MKIFVPQHGALRFTTASGDHTSANPATDDPAAMRLHTLLRRVAQEVWLHGKGWTPVKNKMEQQS